MYINKNCFTCETTVTKLPDEIIDMEGANGFVVSFGNRAPESWGVYTGHDNGCKWIVFKSDEYDPAERRLWNCDNMGELPGDVMRIYGMEADDDTFIVDPGAELMMELGDEYFTISAAANSEFEPEGFEIYTRTVSQEGTFDLIAICVK